MVLSERMLKKDFIHFFMRERKILSIFVSCAALSMIE